MIPHLPVGKYQYCLHHKAGSASLFGLSSENLSPESADGVLRGIPKCAAELPPGKI